MEQDFRECGVDYAALPDLVGMVYELRKPRMLGRGGSLRLFCVRIGGVVRALSEAVKARSTKIDA